MTHRIRPRRLAGSLTATLVGIMIAVSAGPARAQIVLDKGLQDADKKPGRPAVQPNFTGKAVAPWPRLDAGAVMCSTRDDLDQHHRAMQARLGGDADAARDSTRCRLVGQPTPIDVVTRASPSATEIRVKGAATTAWTDTWLPSQPPR